MSDARRVQRLPWEKVIEMFEDILRSNGDDSARALNHITFILGVVGQNLARLLAVKLIDRLDIVLVKPFILKIVQGKIVHPSFMHSLSLLGYAGLGGAVIFDHLTHDPKATASFLEEYLALITPDDARDFVSLASELIDAGKQEIKESLRRHPFFPDDYLEAGDDRFTPAEIADLVARVCDLKNLNIPTPVRIIRAKEFFMFLYTSFKDGNMHTFDVISMLRESLHRYSLDVQVAIDFFASRILQLAVFLAEEAGMAPPTTTDAASLHFVNAKCAIDHPMQDLAVRDVRKIIICDKIPLGTFMEELRDAKFIAIMHHEPPFAMAHPVRIDMPSIRTAMVIFHVLSTPIPVYF